MVGNPFQHRFLYTEIFNKIKETDILENIHSTDIPL